MLKISNFKKYNDYILNLIKKINFYFWLFLLAQFQIFLGNMHLMFHF